MRTLSSIFFLFTVLLTSVGFTPAKKGRAVLYAASVMLPVGSNGEKISLLELSTIKKSDLEKRTGSKMNKIQSGAFRMTQRKLQKGINDKGIVTGKKMKKLFEPGGEKGFHPGGFLLGLFLGLIGVVIAYLIKDEKKKNRVTWAWIGAAAWAAIYLLVFLL